MFTHTHAAYTVGVLQYTCKSILFQLALHVSLSHTHSILVDEARTPLIISEKTVAPVAKYANSAKIASVLEDKVWCVFECIYIYKRKYIIVSVCIHTNKHTLTHACLFGS